MKRFLPRYIYTPVVGLVIVAMSVNPASGGWLLHRLRCRMQSHHADKCCTPKCEVVACEPTPSVECCAEPVGCETVSSHSSSCCDTAPVIECGVTTVDSMMGNHVIDSMSMPEVWSDPMATEHPIEPMDGVEASSSDVAVPSTPTPAEQPKPAEPKPAPAEPAPAEPAPAEPAPAEPAPAEPAPAEPAPAEPAPAEPAPAEPVPAEPVPAEPAPAEPAPAEPAPAEPAPEDDIFGAPPAPAEPAPAAEAPMDDLFGDAPAAPAEPAPAAADDLFGTPAAPAEPAPAAADDLFGAPAGDAAPAAEAPAAAEPNMDDLFGTPGAEAAPAEAAPAEAPAADDIFGAPAPAEAAPAEAAPAEPAKEKDALDDLFGAAPAADEVLGDAFAQTRSRVWIDNTGNFSTEGRLIEIGDGFIRLLKSNGRTCSVPNSRLCPADGAYIASINVVRDDVKVALVSAQ